jgi:hypothetical protein
VKDIIDQCMDICSVSRPRCWGVTFDNSNNKCTLYGSGRNFDQSSLSTSEHVDTAIAKAAQLTSPPPSGDTCPYLDSSYQTSARGEEFVIYCNLDFYGYGDYCPYSLGPLGCPPHADTMAECLEICSEVHPLCTGVSWNPDMKPGYGNCYLKNDITAGKPSAPRGNYTIHSAGVLPSYADISVGCPNDLSYKSKNGESFTIDCYDGRSGSQNFTSTHSQSIYSCMDTCSTHQSEGCTAVVFDDSLLNGYENCYLLNATGTTNKGTNATFAIIDHLNPNPPPSPKSKAWIAGPVIGVVAVTVIAVIAFYYWRRHHSRVRDGEETAQRREDFHEDKKQHSTVVSELKGDAKRSELQSDTNAILELTNEQKPHELHASEDVRKRHELEA